MLVILLLVFFGVFVVIALLLSAGGGGAAQQAERAKASLDAALATGRRDASDQLVDVRKNELMSAVPWINRWLVRIELGARLKTLLNQSGLKWTAGALIMMSVVCFLIPAYLIYTRTGVLIFAILMGILLGWPPLPLLFTHATSDFSRLSRNCRRHWI